MGAYGFVSPSTVAEAVDILASHGDARILAGGTDLVIQLREGKTSTGLLIDLSRVDELRYIKLQEEVISIGSMTTFSQLARDTLVQLHAATLARAAGQVGSVQIRNLGTIGGNLANASPAGDSIPPLLVLEATVEVVRKNGSRRIQVAEVLAGVGKNTLEPLELIKEISFRVPPAGSRSGFVKLGRRKALAIARISMAGLLILDQDRVIREARLALGAVGSTAFRAIEAEEALHHRPLGRAAVSDCLEALQRIVAERLGNRASASYKREAIRGVGEELFYQLFPEMYQ
ncbi:MAG: FAD binding domain-containing protein [Bacillota bacterium]